MFAFVANLSSFSLIRLGILMYIISLLSKFSPGLLKKIPSPRETILFLTQPISWIPDWTVPELSKIWPRDPNFFVARSGYPQWSGVPRSSLFSIVVQDMEA